MGLRDQLKKIQNGNEWIANSSFSIKELYRVFVGHVQKVPWAKLVCQNGAPPKCIFILWLVLHDRLATCSYLERIGVQVDHGCCLCGEGEETMDHMFFECHFVQEVWTQVTTWCGISRPAVKWEVEKVYLFSQCTTNSGKQRLYRCIITILIYHIWLERNSRRMQGRQNPVESIVKHCKFLIAWCCQHDKKLRSFVLRLHSW